MILESHSNYGDDGVKYKKDAFKKQFIPHKKNENGATQFLITFITNKTKHKYRYYLSYNEKEILSEVLLSINNEKEIIFERNGCKINYCEKLKKIIGNTSIDCKSTELFLSEANNPPINMIEITEPYDFFKNEIVMFDDTMFYRRDEVEFTNKNHQLAGQILNNKKIKEQITTFMKPFCKDLIDIYVKKHKQPIDDTPSPFTDKNSTNNDNDKNNSAEKNQIIIKYKDFEIELAQESSGVIKLFTYIAAIFDVINEGKIFIYDELERAIHPIVIRTIIELFNKNTQSNAQGIFTTHASEVLDLRVIRKDQIWFTQLTDEGRETELYSLSEYKGVSDFDNIRRDYISGLYGGVPDKDLIKKIFDTLNNKEEDYEY